MKKTKFLMALLIGTSLTTNTMAEVIDEGTCGSDCHWQFDDETGELHIYGTGDMQDYSGISSNISDYPWGNYLTDIKALRVDNGITSISPKAFNYASTSVTPQLTSVILPDTLKKIGEEAFGTISSLESIDIPNSVTEIGAFAFLNSGLTSLVIPDTVVNIGFHAFYGCTDMEITISPEQLLSSNSGQISRNIAMNSCNRPPAICADARAYFEANPSATTYTYPESLFQTNISDLTIKCKGNISECEAAMSYLNYSVGSYKLAQAAYSIQNADGSILYFDENGQAILKGKKIYTVQEAEKLSKSTGNTFKVRYK